MYWQRTAKMWWWQLVVKCRRVGGLEPSHYQGWFYFYIYNYCSCRTSGICFFVSFIYYYFFLQFICISAIDSLYYSSWSEKVSVYNETPIYVKKPKQNSVCFCVRILLPFAHIIEYVWSCMTVLCFCWHNCS